MLPSTPDEDEASTEADAEPTAAESPDEEEPAPRRRRRRRRRPPPSEMTTPPSDEPIYTIPADRIPQIGMPADSTE